MKITLEIHGDRYVYESESDDYDSAELKEIFSRMLVQATFPPDVIDPADGGCWKCEYKEGE